MMTWLILAAISILILALCVRATYRFAFREGREQGLSESFQLYGGTRRALDKAPPQRDPD